MTDKKRPEWVPDNASDEFATTVKKGVESRHDGMTEESLNRKSRCVYKRTHLTPADYIAGIKQSDRMILARAITLIESNSLHHIELAQDVIKDILPFTGNSLRIGITGVPGAGKSTLIEALGSFLSLSGYKIAVLAVDPTSSLSRGSILGDKTRMEKLSRDENCFIRPSPSGGTLGGVTRKTRETILLCEAAGYNVILIETVGVGQSEITVRSMVDFFLLVKIAGAGDELQGIKRGIMELCDAIVINKADGDNVRNAEFARNEFARALHYLTPVTEGWMPEVLTCSAMNQKGIDSLWQLISKFNEQTKISGIFDKRRKEQLKDWMHSMIQESLLNRFFKNHHVKEITGKLEEAVVLGRIPVTLAVSRIMQVFEEHRDK